MTLQLRPWRREDAAALMGIMNTVDRQFYRTGCPIRIPSGMPLTGCSGSRNRRAEAAAFGQSWSTGRSWA